MLCRTIYKIAINDATLNRTTVHKAGRPNWSRTAYLVMIVKDASHCILTKRSWPFISPTPVCCLSTSRTARRFASRPSHCKAHWDRVSCRSRIDATCIEDSPSTRHQAIHFLDEPLLHLAYNDTSANFGPVSYTHLTLPTIYSV